MKHGFLETAGATRNSKSQSETILGTYRNNQENNTYNINSNIKHGFLEIAGATRNSKGQTETQNGTYRNIKETTNSQIT
jgi:hypothetical protein